MTPRKMILALLALALLTLVSSELPDPLQQVLGLEGGASTPLKAAIGIVVVGGVAWGVGKLIRRGALR